MHDTFYVFCSFQLQNIKYTYIFMGSRMSGTIALCISNFDITYLEINIRYFLYIPFILSSEHKNIQIFLQVLM
jgi:hypothetical protein